jgi:3-methyladenine DNA glycosylase/8-oxoguanine DNA glycosylase
VHGIGLWSAQTFLIHQLHRPDVLPAGDGGIRRAIQQAWELDELPAVNEVRDRAAGWAPYRSYAAALLWRSLRPADEPSDPKARALSREAKDDRLAHVTSSDPAAAITRDRHDRTASE